MSYCYKMSFCHNVLFVLFCDPEDFLLCCLIVTPVTLMVQIYLKLFLFRLMLSL